MRIAVHSCFGTNKLPVILYFDPPSQEPSLRPFCKETTFVLDVVGNRNILQPERRLIVIPVVIKVLSDLANPHKIASPALLLVDLFLDVRNLLDFLRFGNRDEKVISLSYVWVLELTWNGNHFDLFFWDLVNLLKLLILFGKWHFAVIVVVRH